MIILANFYTLLSIIMIFIKSKHNKCDKKEWNHDIKEVETESNETDLESSNTNTMLKKKTKS